MIITLLGYMGSGKSLISKKLAEKINFGIYDLDEEISRRIGCSISEIFEMKGEIFFRRVEREVLEELLMQDRNIVLSLGGGTPCYYNNIELINMRSLSIYLRAKVETLVKNLKPEKHKRPLISDIADDDLPKFIGSHLFERNNYYNQSKIVIDVDSLTIDDILIRIESKVYDFF